MILMFTVIIFKPKYLLLLYFICLLLQRLSFLFEIIKIDVFSYILFKLNFIFKIFVFLFIFF